MTPTSALLSPLPFAVALLAAALPVQAAAKLALAREGQALAKIAVDSAGAIPAEKTAAAELTAYLAKITGATFETVDETKVPAGAAAVYVGQTAFARAHGVAFAGLSQEESVLRTVGGSLVLTGGRPRGTLYAVYDFLENTLGCRWYTLWVERAPRAATLTVPPLNRRVTPYMKLRSHYTYLGDPRLLPDHDAWVRFNVRNRLNDPYGPEFGEGVKPGGRSANHSFCLYVPAERYFRDHPEYFSERDGKRVPSNGVDGNHLCLTNPDVLRIVIDGVKEDLAKNPDGYYYSVSINDGGCTTICDCPQCRAVAAQDGESGLLLRFVNAVADAIRPEHPDKYLLTLAYNPTLQPPKSDLRARDNVIVYLCAMQSNYCYTPDMTSRDGPAQMLLFADWSQHAKHLWAWDYAILCYQRLSYFVPLTWMMDAQMKTAKRLGVLDGVFQEHEISPFEDSMFDQLYELDMWVFAKLCLDPDRDLNALIDDFLGGCYGAAAPALREYVRLLCRRLPGYPYRMVDYSFMSKAQELFDGAEAVTRSDPVVLARVKELRICLDLAALAYRNNIIHEYRRLGGKPDAYPYPVARLKARVLATLDATKNPYFTVMKTYRDDGRGHVPWMTIVRQYVAAVSQGEEYAPLPERFRALPPDRVIDLTAPLLANRYAPVVVPDPEAALGLAVARMNDQELPLPLGTWTHSTRQHAAKLVSAADVTGPGYHLYAGARHPWRGPDSYLYLTGSWQIQVHPWPKPAQPEEWDVYASVKFTGPAYPHGKPDEPNGMFLDRVILVRAEPAAPK